MNKRQDEFLHELNSILHGLSHGDWCQRPSFPWRLHHCATVGGGAFLSWEGIFFKKTVPGPERDSYL